jgi:hypothetical protein
MSSSFRKIPKIISIKINELWEQKTDSSQFKPQIPQAIKSDLHPQKI